MNTLIRLILFGAAVIILSGCSVTSQCAKPTLTPPDGSGPTGRDIKVLIETKTDGASLRWTDDDSQPTPTHGTLIPAPKGYAITVFGRTMRAMAFKTGMTDSEIVEGRYVGQ